MYVPRGRGGSAQNVINKGKVMVTVMVKIVLGGEGVKSADFLVYMLNGWPIMTYTL